MRERYPDRIIQVSFEDLVLRPADELHRICRFLDVEYELGMLEGTQDTGLNVYNQAGFNVERV
jgi:hypothetical protein